MIFGPPNWNAYVAVAVVVAVAVNFAVAAAVGHHQRVAR